jgi:hypothetical protein
MEREHQMHYLYQLTEEQAYMYPIVEESPKKRFKRVKGLAVQ